MRPASLAALLLTPVFVCALISTAPTAASAEVPTLVTGSASALGLDAMTVNGSIHPHGMPTSYYFEYGPTTAYGSRTAMAPLPPRLTAHYHESWDESTGGWAGWGANGLEHH